MPAKVFAQVSWKKSLLASRSLIKSRKELIHRIISRQAANGAKI